MFINLLITFLLQLLLMYLFEQEKKINKNVRGPAVKQFEWFEMETRVRKIIQQVINPIQYEIVKNTSHIENIQKSNDNVNEKIQYILKMMANDPQVFQRGIFKKIEEKFEMQQKTLSFLEEQVKNNTNFIDNKITLIDERMKQSNDMISQIQKLKASNRQNLKVQTQKFEVVRKNIQKNVQIMSQAIEQNQKNLREKIEKLQKKLSESEMTTQYISNQFVKIKEYFEGQKSINDNLIAEQIKAKEGNRFMQEKMNEIDKKLKQLNKLKPFLQDIQTEYKKVLFKVDNIVPLITESQINECIYRVLPQKFHPRIAVYEFERYKDLNEKVLNRHFETQPLGIQFNGEQLIRSAQQRNTKLLTKLKLKHYKSIGVQLDFISFQQREKLMNDFDYQKLTDIIDQLQELENEQNSNKKNLRLTQDDVLNIVQKQLQVEKLRLVQKIETQIQHSKIDIQSTSEVINTAIEKLQNKLQKISSDLNSTKMNLDLSILKLQKTGLQIDSHIDNLTDKIQLFHHFAQNAYQAFELNYLYLIESSPILQQKLTQSHNQVSLKKASPFENAKVNLSSSKIQLSLTEVHNKFPTLLSNMKSNLQIYSDDNEKRKLESSEKNKSSITKITKKEESFSKFKSYSSFVPYRKDLNPSNFQSGHIANKRQASEFLKIPDFNIDFGRKYFRQSHTCRVRRGKKVSDSPARSKFQQSELQGDSLMSKEVKGSLRGFSSLRKENKPYLN